MITFGTKDQIKFDTEESYYFTLGFLVKPDCTELRLEHNEDQGAWGKEVRIHCFGDVENYPAPLKDAFTAGVGKVLRRVNCNEYVQHIQDKHNFVYGKNQDVAAIRATVPPEHLESFDKGLAS